MSTNFEPSPPGCLGPAPKVEVPEVSAGSKSPRARRRRRPSERCRMSQHRKWLSFTQLLSDFSISRKMISEKQPGAYSSTIRERERRQMIMLMDQHSRREKQRHHQHNDYDDSSIISIHIQNYNTIKMKRYFQHKHKLGTLGLLLQLVLLASAGGLTESFMSPTPPSSWLMSSGYNDINIIRDGRSTNGQQRMIMATENARLLDESATTNSSVKTAGVGPTTGRYYNSNNITTNMKANYSDATQPVAANSMFIVNHSTDDPYSSPIKPPSPLTSQQQAASALVTQAMMAPSTALQSHHDTMVASASKKKKKMMKKKKKMEKKHKEWKKGKKHKKVSHTTYILFIMVTQCGDIFS